MSQSSKLLTPITTKIHNHSKSNLSSNFFMNSFDHYYQSMFYAKLNGTNCLKRFNERFHVKGHLGAGAHGIILWAVDREEKSSEKAQHLKQMNDDSGTLSDERHTDDLNQETFFPWSTLCRQYAIKRIFVPNRVIPIAVVREIKVLQYLRGHPNIIDLFDVCPSGSSINLIFPLLPTNLTALIYESHLNLSQCSLYSRMLAEGIAHLHRNGIVHRDIKPSNLLIDWSGVLKLADFGQARAIDIGIEINGQQAELTYQVCTRWYRAPELLYGATDYDYDVDMWSVGCVIGEMIQEWPLFKGETDIEQLSLVVKALGEPSGKWTEQLPDFNKIQFVHEDNNEQMNEDGQYPTWLTNIRKQTRSAVTRCPDSLIDLLSKLCCYTGRMSANQLLLHPFINQVPVDLDRNRLLVKSKNIKHLSGPRKSQLI